MIARFTIGGNRDYLDAIDWHEAARPGLGADFIAAFEATLARLLRFPRMYARRPRVPYGREVRSCLVDGFSFEITYEVTATAVVVLSVVHARSIRQPWHRRLGPNP